MKYVFLLLLTLGFVAVSCGDGTISYEDVTYYKGSEGITMEFMENSPPEKVYAEQTFPLAVELHNAGAYEVADNLFASISVIYDPLYFEETADSLEHLKKIREELELSGKSPYWPEGENRLVTLALLKAHSLPARTGADSPVIVSMCYPYRTLLTTQVCVDSQQNDLREQICYAEDESFLDQGAPVAVQYIDYESMPVGTIPRTVISNRPVTDNQGYIVGTTLDETVEYVTTVRPLLKIHLENIGDGQIVKARDFGEQKLCNKEDGDYPSNTALVRGWLGGSPLECTPNPVKFIEGGADISCTLPVENTFAVNTNFYSVLQLEVSYVYQERDNVEIEIDDSAKQFDPPQILVAKCSDFDRQYDLCRSYAQQGEGISTSLDCYYCVETGVCVSGASMCSQCGTHTDADDATKRCVEECGPEQPTLLNNQINGRKTVTVGCKDPSSVDDIDHHLCGCNAFYYTWVDEQNKCPETVSRSSYTQRIDGSWDQQKRMTTASISIPSDLQNKNSVLCVVAQSAGEVFSDPRTFKIELQP